jgi:hypothetical protein
MVPERMLFESIFMHIQGLTCKENVYELEYHVRHETLNLLPKNRLVKMNPPQVFPITY